MVHNSHAECHHVPSLAWLIHDIHTFVPSLCGGFNLRLGKSAYVEICLQA